VSVALSTKSRKDRPEWW